MSIKPNLEFENKVFSSNSYGNFKIIKYYSVSKIEIEFITTKYKTFTNLSNKEKCIKEYADKHKKELTDKVYKALYNYIIEITD